MADKKTPSLLSSPTFERQREFVYPVDSTLDLIHVHSLLNHLPALFGLDSGIWYHIQEGIKGILVRDEHGRPHVYMLTQPASHYYQVMTRNQRMPVMIGEQL